jgi:ABC-type lipoprotein release transport system permease subunit
MEAIKLAWRNLWRIRRRTLLTLAAGGLGLMFTQGYTNLAAGVYGKMVDDGVRAGSGHAALYAPGYLPHREPARTFPLSDLVRHAGALPAVTHVLPRLYLPGLAQSARGSRSVVLVGVHPEAERAVNPFARALRDGRFIEDRGGREAVVGHELAGALKLRIGSKLVVMTQDAGGPIVSELLRVVGIVSTGIKEADGATVFMGLDTAGLLFGRPGAVHEVAVVLDSADSVPPVLRSLSSLAGSGSDWQAVSWEEAMPDLSSHIRTDLFTLRTMVGFIYLIIAI